MNALPKGSFFQLGAKTTEKIEEVTTSRDDTTVEVVERKRYLSRTASALLSMDESVVGGNEQRRNLTRHQSAYMLGNAEYKKRKEVLKKSLEKATGLDRSVEPPLTQHQVMFADDGSDLTSDNRTIEEIEGPWRPPDSIEHHAVHEDEHQTSLTKTTTTSRTTVTTTVHSVQSSPRKGGGTQMV